MSLYPYKFLLNTAFSLEMLRIYISLSVSFPFSHHSWTSQHILCLWLSSFILPRLHSFQSVFGVPPHSDLDLSKYVVNPNHPPPVYDLYAVINHYGGLGGGHCKCVCVCACVCVCLCRCVQVCAGVGRCVCRCVLVGRHRAHVHALTLCCHFYIHFFV